MFRMLINEHYPHPANEKLRSWAKAVFQNRGVCGQAFPLFPSPSPVIHFFFFCSRSNFLDEPREETLATQAIRTAVLHKCIFPCETMEMGDALYAHKDLKTLELTVNAELHNLYNWLTSNKLSLNIKKEWDTSNS